MSLDDFDWDKCEKGYRAKVVLEDFYKKVGADVAVDLGSLYKDMDCFLDSYEHPPVYWSQDASSI